MTGRYAAVPAGRQERIAFAGFGDTLLVSHEPTITLLRPKGPRELALVAESD
jgi:hypothetical protein